MEAEQGSEKNLQRWLETALESRTDQIAISDGQASLSYRELEIKSRSVASFLHSRGIRPGDLVALKAEKNLQTICTVLGILRSGAAYLPLDPGIPETRMRNLLHLASPSLLMEDCEDAAFPVREALGFAPISQFPKVDVSSPAYVLFTSGSTGAPKAVEISHSAAFHFVRWAASLVGLGSKDSVLSTSSLGFDLSTFDLFSTLGSGSRLVLAPKGSSTFPASLARFMEKEGISVWYTVPSLIRMLADHGRVEGLDLKLRALLSAGDRFATAAALRIRESTGCRLFNLYGPTETNVCTAFEIPKTFGPDQNVPIGSPVPGNECLILLESGQMEDFGKGELLVAGSHVMTGYRNSSNEGCFLEWNQKRFYKTGDIVERREREEFQLIGRKDGLVKSWGYRVHPGESEKILQALPGVKDAAVIALPHSQAGFLLYAAVVQEEGGSLDVDGLISRLRQELLPAAVPGEFRILDALPLNANGKVDRVALAQLLSVKN